MRFDRAPSEGAAENVAPSADVMTRKDAIPEGMAGAELF